MKKEVIGKCPICGGNLHVERLSCNNCHTAIEGDFELCKFCKLSKEEKYFIEVFLKNRGNIKEIEKELNLSYPTVRSRLEDVISALGYNSEPIKPQINKQEILDKLDRGEITSDDALELLKGKK